MSRFARYPYLMLLAALACAGVFGCAKKETAEKVETDAPLSNGYESAIATAATKPIFRPSGTGPAVYGPGDLYTYMATGEETNNTFFQFEAVVPEGGGPPPHIHSREDESFYVVKGSLEITLGDKVYQAKAGDFVYVPRGTLHRFRNSGKGTAVQLVTFVPAGMEKFFNEVFPPVTDRTAAPPPTTPELIQKLNDAAPKYGIEFPVPPADSAK